MEQLNKWLTPLNTMALVVMAFVMLVGGNQSANYGGSTSATWTAANLVSEGTITASGGISGTTGSFTSTLAATATTTLSDGLVLNNSAICIDFYATSSATRVHMTASTTPTLPNGAAGVMTFDYGACAN